MTNVLLLLLYTSILLAIGVYSGKRKGADAYLIAQRDVGATELGCSVSAGFLDGFVLVSYTGYVYIYGWSAMALFVGIALGFVLFFIFAKELNAEGRENKYYGMSDYFEKRYGHRAALLVSVFNIVFYIALVLIQFIFGSKILSEISSLPYTLCLLIVALMLLSYVAFGGFRAVLLTDMFQWILIVFILIVLFPRWFRYDHLQEEMPVGFSFSPSVCFSFLLIGCMGVFSAPELWQRCFAARDSGAVRKGLFLAGTMFPLAGVLLASIGFIAHTHFPGLAPDDALVQVFKHSLPIGLSGAALFLLLSAILSTADTAIFVIAPTFTVNILRVVDERKLRRTTILTVISVVVISVLLGLLVRDVLAVAFSLAGLSVGLFPVLFGGLIWKIEPSLVIISLASAICSVLILIFCGVIGPTTSLITLPIAIGCLVIGTVVRRFLPAFRK